MAGAIVTFTGHWSEHLKTCTPCEDWFLNGGQRNMPRCVHGYAISEVLEDELEKGMPADERAISGESPAVVDV